MGQELTIEAGNSRRSLPIDQIDHVKLEGDMSFPKPDRPLKVPDVIYDDPMPSLYDPDEELTLQERRPNSTEGDMWFSKPDPPLKVPDVIYHGPMPSLYDPDEELTLQERRPNSTEVFLVKFLVRIDGFEWEDSERGIARIKPEAVVQVDGRSGIPRAMQGRILRGDSRYVVREMRFFPEEGQMKITAALLRPRLGDS